MNTVAEEKNKPVQQENPTVQDEPLDIDKMKKEIELRTTFTDPLTKVDDTNEYDSAFDAAMQNAISTGFEIKQPIERREDFYTEEMIKLEDDKLRKIRRRIGDDGSFNKLYSKLDKIKSLLHEKQEQNKKLLENFKEPNKKELLDIILTYDDNYVSRLSSEIFHLKRIVNNLEKLKPIYDEPLELGSTGGKRKSRRRNIKKHKKSRRVRKYAIKKRSS